LLTALSLLTVGTYDRLPSDLTEAFTPRTPLTNGSILETLRRLDAHILYRLKCIDYVPPDLAIERIMDGRAYVTGGNKSWRAELSLTGFGEDESSRWWLTGVEWLWKSRSDEKGKGGKRFKGVERQEILDLVNREILPPEDTGATTTAELENEVDGPKKVDAPLVRLVNFIRKLVSPVPFQTNVTEHLSLTYQLEVLFQQAMSLSREKWRNHLMVEIDRPKKKLVLKYWM
jgi:mediator of RNA polymerase II transcription subunit 14